MAENNNKETNPAVSINLQYIKSIKFDTPNTPMIFKEINSENSPNIDLNIDVSAGHIEKNLFNVDLIINGNSSINEKKCFNLNVVYSAIVEINNLPKEEIEKVLLIDIPTYIFPFARSIVAQTVSDSNFPPLLLTPVNFKILYENSKEEPTVAN